MACYHGDLPSVRSAIAEGASVNDPGRVAPASGPSWQWPVRPLYAAIYKRADDVVVHLLAHGADPNGANVVWAGAYFGTPRILQLLVDAGGCVNSETAGRPPLFWTINMNKRDMTIVLLGQPSLDLAATHAGVSVEEAAEGNELVEGMVLREVRQP